jgi:cation diffusion facilitator CzcD-associated flavoprotein CzcO
MPAVEPGAPAAPVSAASATGASAAPATGGRATDSRASDASLAHTADGGVTVTDVVVVGSGFSGICTAIRLKQSGREDFVVLEKSDDLGGTWRDNTYPGCACDVPSHLYSFSFAQNPRWTRMFSPQREIWDYLRDCVQAYGLAPHCRFGAEVTELRFDERSDRWLVTVRSGQRFDCRVVVLGVGTLHHPFVPDLPGLDSFRGTMFHSAHWRHDHDLTGQRVAVVGTGASAIQFVPQIAPRVGRLDLYQRTPAWITPKPDPRIAERKQQRYARHPGLQRSLRDAIFWGLEVRGLGFATTPRAMAMLEKQATAHLARQIHDPALRSKLTPAYQIGCKRVLLSNDFYPTLERDHVHLVTEPIAEVTPTGIRTRDGTTRGADAIIFGTGFDISANRTHPRVLGRHGRRLDDVWERDGRAAHLGITVAGFPNLFLLLGPNTGLGHNSVVFMIESQARYVIQALDLLDRTGARRLEVRAAAQRRSVERVRSRLPSTVWMSGCRSWYLDQHGRNVAIWPYFAWTYWLATRRLRRRDFTLTR